MRAIGLDVGTTTICAVVVDGETGSVIEAVTRINDSCLESAHEWEKKQDAAVILNRAKELVQGLSSKYAPIGCIGVTGQMHGILYIDKDGNAVSPLYTWQDGRGDMPFEDGNSYCEVLARKTNHKLARGYGAVTHYYNLLNRLVPESARHICTIHDYVAMKLARRTVPVMNSTDAASLGLFDIKENTFDDIAIARAGMDIRQFPQVVCGAEVIGATQDNIPVAVAVGDNQASFLGSVQSSADCILVNVGTGSQISVYIPNYIECPHVDTRPFDGNGFLLVGAPLCGGRAYALLEHFFRETVHMATGRECASLYDVMNNVAEEYINAKNKLDITTLFCGTREDSSVRGAVRNIGIDNFTPQHFIVGVLEGMVRELYGLYENMRPHLVREPTMLIGSGNGIRKNPLLQRLFAKKFDMPLQIPAFKEEAAFGAALFALVSVGYFKDLSQAQATIRYQD